jgi:hypothetical protein
METRKHAKNIIHTTTLYNICVLQIGLTSYVKTSRTSVLEVHAGYTPKWTCDEQGAVVELRTRSRTRPSSLFDAKAGNNIGDISPYNIAVHMETHRRT